MSRTRRNKAEFTLNDPETWLQKACAWADQYPYFIHLNNQQVAFPGGAFPLLIGVASERLEKLSGNPFNDLISSMGENGDWHLGYLTYDCKNYIEELDSKNPALYPAPDYTFFVPEVLIRIEGTTAIIESAEATGNVFASISDTDIREFQLPENPEVHCTTDRRRYIDNVQRIRQHIIEGDIYELNYCIAPFLANIELNPIATYFKLSQTSPAPFSCLVKDRSLYLISASPERFLRKQNDLLLSQPIKGTIRRGNTPEEDEVLKRQLKHDEKERAENMMIVDLVRNDLARSSQPGSVSVKEMFGIYSFEQLSQMISTVESRLNPHVTSMDAVRNAFPMGSMTGAPKVKAMELIDRYEDFRRGIYSGTVGFITPDQDFDFNVVIRSMIYDSEARTVAFPVGSAITYDSDPASEYRECWLKAQGILKTLGIPDPSLMEADFLD